MVAERDGDLGGGLLELGKGLRPLERPRLLLLREPFLDGRRGDPELLGRVDERAGRVAGHTSTLGGGRELGDQERVDRLAGGLEGTS